MLLNTMEKPGAEGVSSASGLLDLVGQARRCVEADPGMTRHCLERIAALLTQEQPGHAPPIATPATMPASMPATAPAAPPRRQPAKGGLAAWQLRRVCDHVERHLDTTLLIEELAGLVRLSAGHFCRAFKISTGETPHGFIMRQRVLRAQRLMLNTNDTLSQIACACGLSDQAHLTRLFRRMLDDTPLAWRRHRRAA
jgi:AraC family transcriptional regulator